MKYVVILGDGMADEPLEELNNQTPLQVAKKPVIDYLASHGEMGSVRTVPEGLAPGSDTANLAVMGYDPCKYYSGRSPLEAVSMGVSLSDRDITFRCNLITLSEEESYENKIILDHSADEISSEEAKQLIEMLKGYFQDEFIKFYPGVSYRHLITWMDGSDQAELIPPHDILGKQIKDYLPKGDNSTTIYKMMEESYALLSKHPINMDRVERGLRPANSIWIWGEGRKPDLPSFKEKYGLEGSVISAVDLIKGIAISGGLRSVDIPGSTGNIHTNFVGKAQGAVRELVNGQDFVYVHIEAPDECGHRYEIHNKVRSIELIDEKVVKVIKEELDKYEEPYKIMILPDHPTPLHLRTHTSDPVPYLIYESNKEEDHAQQRYDEFYAKKAENYFENGYTLMDYFLTGNKTV